MIQFMGIHSTKNVLAALGTGNKHVQSSARCQNKAEISHLPFHVYDSCKATQKHRLTATTYFVFVSFLQQRTISSVNHSLGFFFEFYPLINSSVLKQQNELN